MLLKEFKFEMFKKIDTIAVHPLVGMEYLEITDDGNAVIRIWPDYKTGVMKFEEYEPICHNDDIDCYRVKEGLEIVEIEVSTYEISILFKLGEYSKKIVCRFKNMEFNKDNEFVKGEFDTEALFFEIQNSELYSEVLCESYFF